MPEVDTESQTSTQYKIQGARVLFPHRHLSTQRKNAACYGWLLPALAGAGREARDIANAVLAAGEEITEQPLNPIISAVEQRELIGAVLAFQWIGIERKVRAISWVINVDAEQFLASLPRTKEGDLHATRSLEEIAQLMKVTSRPSWQRFTLEAVEKRIKRHVRFKLPYIVVPNDPDKKMAYFDKLTRAARYVLNAGNAEIECYGKYCYRRQADKWIKWNLP